MSDPALVFQSDAAKPGTHVLLIGIGEYPWLLDGAECTTPQQQARALGMGQLGAPPLSIRALADWFLAPHGFANTDKPLASLALLLSEPGDPHYHGHPVPRGTAAEVAAAVSEWLDRANGWRDNALVYGFCGHGVQSGNPVLLCRDYAENPQNRFEGAIDFDEFRIALSTRQPDTQLLLIDACRTPDIELAQLGQKTPGNPLIGLDSLTTRDNAPALQSVHYATSLYTEAWGPHQGPSLFTEALLDALAGGGANQADDWWVTTSRLHAALATYLVRISRDAGISQRPSANTQEFRITKPAKIELPLYVRSADPAVWAQKLTVRASRGSEFSEDYHHDPANGADGCAFRLANTPSQEPEDVLYEITAEFDAPPKFANALKRVIAYPPEVTCDLQVRPR
jgi:Caspase domain